MVTVWDGSGGHRHVIVIVDCGGGGILVKIEVGVVVELDRG